ncbi:calcium-binding protein [Epibacterium sp. SM1979]|uniref:Calcium-binding protein n=1 Tax=Tritonibacter litoralis TaxID=2662264 RepID=A0A843YJH3_9RHOB|nr:calcium-binding protein [Tritonibacter litoralis]MQQ09584.1 calcium-binding protein [Tritonibacter litoralis]
MDLRFLDGFSSAQGVADLVLVADPGPGATAPLLVAVERVGGGLRVFGVDDLTERDYRPHQGAHLGTGSAVVLGAEGGRILLANSLHNRLDSHLVDETGEIGARNSWTLPGLASGGQVGVLASTTSQGQDLVYALADGSLRGWRIDETGGATAVSRGGAATSYALDQVTDLHVADILGAQVLLAADPELGGLRSFRIAAGTGGLTPSDQLGTADGLGVATPTALTTLTTYGDTWAVLGAAGTSSLSLLQVGRGGDLTLVDHLIDSRGSRFGHVSAVESFVVDGHAFVLAAGGDGGMELFRLLPTGQLVQAAQAVHATGQGLDNVTALETYVTADEVVIFVASEGGLNEDGEGIAQYGLSRAELGQVVTATGGSVAGTGGDDVLLGNGTATHIQGRAGDDMLVMGAAGDRLTGGAGADIFVAQSGIVAQGGNRITITDFDPRVDQLDLSLLDGLRGLAQLHVSERSNGIDLAWNGLEIRVLSQDGRRLSLADLWPTGWHHAHHLPIGETLPASTLGGGAGADSLLGDDADESIAGGAGNDTLDGQSGADVLDGGTGRDLLLGGHGADTLLGGENNDRLQGGSGSDRLEGGAGADQLFGGIDQDALFGGLGDDQLDGGAGDDRLDGGNGHDHLRGGAGFDSLNGGDGNDHLESGEGGGQLLGEAGQDLLQGGSAADQLDGGSGADTLRGGGDHDRLVGGAGQDSLFGDAGADSLWGDGDDDFLWGGTGNDSLLGGAGLDRLWGEAGQDTLRGGSGADTLRGGSGSDRIWGDGGNDRIWGGAGHDTIQGKAGADSIQGNGGHDLVLSHRGRDSIHGGAGRDTLKAHGGRDDVWGGPGHDRLEGGGHGDHLRGGNGRDQLFGQAGHDFLEGQQGNDTLRGNNGNDRLRGGLGADVFIFDNGNGRDRVLDFVQGQDLLHLRFLGRKGAQRFEDLEMRHQGNDLIVDIGTGQIILDGLAGLSLEEDDFLF